VNVNANGEFSVVLIIASGIFGLLIGSFLNVVVWRVPRGESINHPSSHCPTCGHAIRWFDNIPVISWLVLRGRCRDCGSRISLRYPAVELGTGVSFALVALWFVTARMPLHSSVTAGALELVAFLYLAAISIALALIDLDVFRLPNAIVLPAYVAGTLLLGLSALFDGDAFDLVRAAIGAAGLFLFYFLIVIAYPKGMGLGDVKLAGVLGLFLAWTGWGSLVVGAFAAFLLGGLFGILLLVSRRVGRKSRIPFGPWMIAGSWVGIAAGERIAGEYLALFGL
jgi:leader peptidase (prepilin peptidase)/N-methyltransferase